MNDSACPPALLALCRWLALLDGWATFYETDPDAETQPTREPLSASERAQALYLLKERAMQTLYTASLPAISLGVLEGPPRETRVWLCDRCRSKAQQRGMHPRDYAREVGPCPQCQQEGGDRDYYSLYVLRVDCGPQQQWQFHTPVPLGRQYLPSPRSKQAPTIGQRPRDPDGRMQRLGRPLGRAERRQFPEAEVVYQVWQALNQLRQHATIEQ